MNQYVVSRAAKDDLDTIWDYIAEDNVDAADRWIGRLLSQCELLAQNPRLGHTRGDLTDLAVLFWPVAGYLIIYGLQEQGIEIVAVIQGSRDIPALLRNRD
jgi:plasmid stabilization system protein ParE